MRLSDAKKVQNINAKDRFFFNTEYTEPNFIFS